MDLSSYVAAHRRVLWALLVVPLLVGLSTGIHTAQTLGERYRATVQVSVTSSTSLARETDQLVEDLNATVTSDAVVDRVAERLRVPAAEVEEGLSASRVSPASSFVEIAVVARSEDTARRLAAAVAGESLRVVLQPGITAAQASYEALDAQFQDLVDAGDPSVSGVELGPVDAAVNRRQQDQVLAAALRANVELIDLQNRLAVAVEQADEEQIEVRAVDAVTEGVRRGAVNGGAALFLLVALLVAVEFLRTSRHRPEAATGSAAPVSIAPATAVQEPDPAARVEVARVQEPVVQEPVVQEPVVQEPVAQEPTVQEPVAQGDAEPDHPQPHHPQPVGDAHPVPPAQPAAPHSAFYGVGSAGSGARN